MSTPARFLLAFALLAAACGTSPGPTTASTDGGPDTQTQDSGPWQYNGDCDGIDGGHPYVDPATVDSVVQGNNTFASSMFGELINESSGSNVFFSPLSISTALSMTYVGANGQTATQLAQVLDLPSVPNQQLAAAYGSLAMRLQSDGHTSDGGQIDLANAVFGQQNTPFEPTFLGLLSADFGTSMMLLDFAGNPDGARQRINQWVSDHTDQMIPQLLAPGTVTPDMKMVLANALYFDEQWATPFEPGATQMAAFHVSAQQTVTVPMMSNIAIASYYADSNVQMVELPFASSNTAIDFILPAPIAGAMPDPVTGLAALEKQASSDNLKTWTGQAKSEQVQVTIPKFKVDYTANLIPAFEKLGLSVPFDPTTADFSGIDGARDLYIALIQHEAVLNVDEAGVTAAAATAVGIAGSAAPEQQATFNANQPFVVAIRDLGTGTVLFVGQITDPSK